MLKHSCCSDQNIYFIPFFHFVFNMLLLHATACDPCLASIWLPQRINQVQHHFRLRIPWLHRHECNDSEAALLDVLQRCCLLEKHLLCIPSRRQSLTRKWNGYLLRSMEELWWWIRWLSAAWSTASLSSFIFVLMVAIQLLSCFSEVPKYSLSSRLVNW